MLTEFAMLDAVTISKGGVDPGFSEKAVRILNETGWDAAPNANPCNCPLDLPQGYFE